MKYLCKVLIVLLVLFFSAKLVIHLFDKGHKVNYSLGNFSVKETLKVDSGYGVDNYYFVVKHEDFKMNFQVFTDYNKAHKVIEKIRYYSFDDYQCVLPIFKGGEILTDIMCLNGNDITYYHDMDVNDAGMDKFVASLKKDGYSLSNYVDKMKSRSLSNTQVLYEDNLVENHYVAVETYRGLNLISSTIEAVRLFDNDVYKKPISIFTDKFYVVADYNSEYTFKKFYVVNLINGNIQEIRSYDEISFDSVVQGVVDGEIYIFDKDSKIQYKVNLEHENVESVASLDGIKYYNGQWSFMSLNEALNGKLFDNYYSDEISGYNKVDALGDFTGYYYMYKAVDDKFLVYRADVQNSKIRTYLFTTTDLNSIVYLNDYIYFKDGTVWKYYGNMGVRKVMENSELEFNDDITLGVYAK